MGNKKSKVQKVVQSEWMTNLPSEITTQPLNQLAIPGSHDSSTSTLTICSVASPDGDAYDLVRHLPNCVAGFILLPWTVTQSNTMAQQLVQGIRYFDLRIAVRPGISGSDAFYLVHGQYICPVSTVLSSVAQFLSSHPKEIVLLDCNHCYEFATDEQKEDFGNMVINLIGSYMFAWDGTIPSLEKMWQAKKQVIFFSCALAKGNTNFWPEWRMVSLWPRTTEVKTMIEFLDEHYSPQYVRESDRFYVFQGILTPDADYIIRHPFSSVRRLSKEAGKAYLKWIQAPSRLAGMKGVNITLLDFVENFPTYVQDIINLNYKTWKPKTRTSNFHRKDSQLSCLKYL